MAFREGESLNLGLSNPNPHCVSQRVLVVGGGPVGLRLAIQLKLSGHQVTVFEKRREKRSEELEALGFTNRINRPHVFFFLRNDLERLNGRNWMTSKMCYPIFTQGDTASIGIDELQVLLLKNALLLGVDFRVGVCFDDAHVEIDPKTSKPRWKVKCTYDEKAAADYNKQQGSCTEVFDVLMGCDGARSRVRESQPQFFGEVDKRAFKKMMGVVGNVQKVSRKRLIELGFPSGQEPSDMKRAHQGGGRMTGLNYYKASYHNYVIFTPTKDDLIAAGIDSDGVYTFQEGRAQANPTKAEEKKRLKKWVSQRCKEVGIPIDETLSNEGFVEAPNDCMLFDFSEIWKCKKNFAVNLPPPDYDVERDGPWTGHELIPPIGLVGDAVTEPFWIAGVGLQRGWNGLMDACYIIDNLYNMTFSGDHTTIESPSWDDHMERVQGVLPKLHEYAHDGRMTKEGLQGEHADQGPVMVQLRKHYGSDAEKPRWQLEIEPYSRYEPLYKFYADMFKGAKVNENMHPNARKAIELRKSADGASPFMAKKLVSFAGKLAPGSGSPQPAPISTPHPPIAAPSGAKMLFTYTHDQQLQLGILQRLEEERSRLGIDVQTWETSLVVTSGNGKSVDTRKTLKPEEFPVSVYQLDTPPTPMPPRKDTLQEVEKVAPSFLDSLNSKLAKQMDKHVQDSVSSPEKRSSVCFDDQLWKELPQDGGYIQRVETAWDVMTEQHLSPAQKAELTHIRNMKSSLQQQIASLQNSLKAFEKAEIEMLTGGSKA